MKALRKEDLSLHHIAKRVKRSTAAVHKIVTGSQTGRNRKISRSTVRALICTASNGHYSARDLVNMISLDVFVRRVQLLLHDATHLV